MLTTTIPAVTTNIGVVILRNTYKGQELKTDFSTSVDELIDKVGKPTSTAHCYQDILTSAAFLKVANKLYHTRAMPVSASFAGTKVPSGADMTCLGFTENNALILTDLFNDDPDNFGDYAISGNYVMWLIASSRGSYGNNIRIAIADKHTQDLIIQQDASVTSWETYNTLAAVDERLQDESEFLIVVEIKKQNTNSWTQLEYFRVSSNENQLDDQGRSIFVETVINQQSDYLRASMNATYLNTEFRMSTSEWQTLSGGQDNNGDTVTDSIIEDALDLYSNAEELDVSIFIDSNKSETVKQYTLDICETRKDCVAVLDCNYNLVVDNRGNETNDLIDWRRGLGSYKVDNMNVNTSYGALYGNWGEVYDKYNQKYRWIPLSGHVAAAYAYTDDVTDPWYAPAGLNRGILDNIRRLAWNPTLGNRDLLYKNGINPIVSFAGQGKVIWGQKTLLDKPSAFNRMNVRRLFIVLEKALSTSAKYFLFEPNTSFTRLALRNMIEPYLREVKGRQGIYDFLVVCDETNNTSERIDREELWVDIYIKPVRAAEFIQLNMIATKTGASFTEIAEERSI